MLYVDVCFRFLSKEGRHGMWSSRSARSDSFHELFFFLFCKSAKTDTVGIFGCPGEAITFTLLNLWRVHPWAIEDEVGNTGPSGHHANIRGDGCRCDDGSCQAETYQTKTRIRSPRPVVQFSGGRRGVRLPVVGHCTVWPYGWWSSDALRSPRVRTRLTCTVIYRTTV